MSIATFQEAIDRGRVSTYLSANDNAKGNLFGPKLAAPGSPVSIALITDALDWAANKTTTVVIVPEIRGTVVYNGNNLSGLPGGTDLQSFVADDPTLGVPITFGNFIIPTGSITIEVLVAQIVITMSAAAAGYGYLLVANGTDIEVTAPIGDGSSINGQVFGFTWPPSSSSSSAFSGGDNEITGIVESKPARLVANYLVWLCGMYGQQAQAILNGGGGGSVTPINPGNTTVLPLYLKSNDFTDETHYDNPNIVGVNVSLFVNELTQQWLFAPDDFEYTSTGINVLYPGFSALTDDYNMIMIQINTP